MDELPSGLIDSHFHLLAMQKKGIDIFSLMEEMQRLNMQGVDIGVEFDDLDERSELVSPFPFIHLSAGIGPWGVAEGLLPVAQQLGQMAASLSRHKVCAIGEIGLDNYWNYGTKESQQDLFASQMDLAEELGLPIIVHTREADTQMMDMLVGRTFSRQGIMHCFQGSPALAKLAISKGMFISFAGPLTYKGNDAMRELCKSIPLDHMLLETDGPYLSPVPQRGKTNTPLHMVYIYEYASSLLNVQREQLIVQMATNFSTFSG
ncbi:TatD family hydrolase [Sphaerochaeta sp. PS]|uniref:TatD family hydrolase n=1 Tax=Sphaerochaeta sp. PS TaxID=3076336 RepID=UPI0028A44287|nr:TatD family hydrolase [Sphaerochaeta sp. PS]MDT4763332.1 TatD family hydrolase [Sphaerochaeta sp. PS]